MNQKEPTRAEFANQARILEVRLANTAKALKAAESLVESQRETIVQMKAQLATILDGVGTVSVPAASCKTEG
jgi:uncharacterized coiled-coil protein SlyX